ncbi:PUA domain-containing protein [Halorubrum distributum]|uniref:PUA domain containing protein n=2 Tax=Halorubrum distributum TaxID=29283 RepID=M0D193_9EURY|nr:PUA domain-containing protein [Halorubrum terrestre]ELZ28623.1 PUA domain containing protein [Halorubrum terrestre JCM 10247]MYL17074.1 pseudouridine synthase [Halorubrum terrestre]MYL66394.1 pseudouridine synthase [Halorubrum terrestre]
MTDADTLADLRTAADYQFGAGAGEALFPPDDALTVRRSSGGRPRQVIDGDVDDTPGSSEGDRLVSYGTDGRFTLGLAGGKRIAEALPEPRHRMVVGEESEPFVREGRNAFAKFVTAADDGIRPGDEVLVVDESGAIFGVGRAELSGVEAEALGSGVAVKTRDGNPADGE